MLIPICLAGLEQVRSGSGPDVPSLVIFPDIYGNPLYVEHLLPHLDNSISIYVVGSEIPDESRVGLPQMGEHFADVITAARLPGPIIFVGHSFAGYLAIEAARAMSNRAEPVDNVILIDTAVPVRLRRARVIDRLEWLRVWGLDAVRQVARRIGGRDPQSKTILSVVGGPKVDLSRHPSRRHDAIRSFVSGLERYRIKPLRVPLSLIVASERRFSVAPGPTLGWEQYVTDTIEVCEIEGEHVALILDPSLAAKTAAKIQAVAERQRSRPKAMS